MHVHIAPASSSLAAQQDLTRPLTKVLSVGCRPRPQHLFLCPRESRGDALSAIFPASGPCRTSLRIPRIEVHLFISNLRGRSRFQVEPRTLSFACKTQSFQ